MESVQLEHENVTEFVLVTLRDRVEEGRRFSNEEKDPMTSKELSEELYEYRMELEEKHPFFRGKDLGYQTTKWRSSRDKVCMGDEREELPISNLVLEYLKSLPVAEKTIRAISASQRVESSLIDDAGEDGTFVRKFETQLYPRTESCLQRPHLAFTLL
ncbi:hypothetical protein GOBAR_DD19207 [Gossypium barbadense]|nr:hypothetical protein GOBAR_DD19207 [Gossypium barbadense]